jgi:asparagine synthase (glutamine-hydrolysing)
VCGICGVLNEAGGRAVDPTTVRRMTSTLFHRGPDEDGFFFDGAVGLGMRRLSIIDLDGGHQPVSNETGDVHLVFNGEIYNFQPLRVELERLGHRFRSRSDTEVIVHAWEEWERDAFPRLNGMYAIALWDGRTHELVLARDPFGVKPLYWTRHAGTVVFGSEIRAILAHGGIERAVDAKAMQQMLALRYVPSPSTAFRGIHKVPPGHLLRCKDDRLDLERIPSRKRPSARATESELLEELDRLLRAAVERQLIADVPVGVLLSGGLDSSLVASYVREIAGPDFDAFTVGFSSAFRGDERLAAQTTAAWLGCRHHEVTIDAGGFASSLASVVGILEEPLATTSTIPFLRLSELARRSVKVVLSGQGADEPFAGYARHLGERLGGAYRALPRWVRDGLFAPAISALPRLERLKRGVRALGIEDIDARFLHVYRVDLARDVGLDDAAMEGLIHRWRQEASHLEPLNQMTYVDARTSLPDFLLLYTDKLSMSVSLETRVPFLDLELMEFVESLPASEKVRGRRGKHLLRRLAVKRLPPEVVGRRKVGFETPVGSWLRDRSWADLVAPLTAAGSALHEYVPPALVKSVVTEHTQGHRDHSWLLFSLLTADLWLRTWMRDDAVALGAASGG